MTPRDSARTLSAPDPHAEVEAVTHAMPCVRKSPDATNFSSTRVPQRRVRRQTPLFPSFLLRIRVSSPDRRPLGSLRVSSSLSDLPGLGGPARLRLSQVSTPLKARPLL